MPQETIRNPTTHTLDTMTGNEPCTRRTLPQTQNKQMIPGLKPTVHKVDGNNHRLVQWLVMPPCNTTLIITRLDTPSLNAPLYTHWICRHTPHGGGARPQWLDDWKPPCTKNNHVHVNDPRLGTITVLNHARTLITTDSTQWLVINPVHAR